MSLAKNTEICSQNKLTRMDSPTERFLNLVWLHSIREVLFIADEAGAEIVMEPSLVLPSESFIKNWIIIHIQKQPNLTPREWTSAMLWWRVLQKSVVFASFWSAGCPLARYSHKVPLHCICKTSFVQGRLNDSRRL